MRTVLERLLETHGASFPRIRAVYYDPFNECSNDRREIHGISLMVCPPAPWQYQQVPALQALRLRGEQRCLHRLHSLQCRRLGSRVVAGKRLLWRPRHRFDDQVDRCPRQLRPEARCLPAASPVSDLASRGKGERAEVVSRVHGDATAARCARFHFGPFGSAVVSRLSSRSGAGGALKTEAARVDPIFFPPSLWSRAACGRCPPY